MPSLLHVLRPILFPADDSTVVVNLEAGVDQVHLATVDVQRLPDSVAPFREQVDRVHRVGGSRCLRPARPGGRLFGLTELALA